MGRDDVYPVKTFKIERLYLIYINLTHETHQWLLLEFLVLLMMGAESVRNMYLQLLIRNTILPKVASGWFFIQDVPGGMCQTSGECSLS